MNVKMELAQHIETGLDDETEGFFAPPLNREEWRTIVAALRGSSPAQEPAHAALQDNLREAWAALAMLREAVETLAPIGSVKASEHLDGPTFMHEADAIVEGIRKISGQEPVTTEPVAWRYQRKEYWGNCWRLSEISNPYFETLGDWLIEPLYALPAPPQPGRDANDKHYLAMIRHHLKRLYSVYPNNARLREQISDEIDWIDAALAGGPK